MYEEERYKRIKEVLRELPEKKGRPSIILSMINAKYGKDAITRKILWKILKEHSTDFKIDTINKQHTEYQLIESNLPPGPKITVQSLPSLEEFENMEPTMRRQLIIKRLEMYFQNFLVTIFLDFIPRSSTGKMQDKDDTKALKFNRRLLGKMIQQSMKYEPQLTRGILKTLMEKHKII
ncbi:MAG: hypothetical protein ACREBB_11830 [Nitrosotalea sp.]